MKKAIPDSYTLINFIFTGVILLVFFYSFLYGFKGTFHPIPSGSPLISDTSISTGLSRSFSAMTHLDLKQAKDMNPYGPRLFSFFLLQLFMRLTGIIIYKNPGQIQRSVIPVADALLSGILFIVFFLPFILNMIRGALC